jgi:NADH dehydrogenase FAD-containing subunit
MERKHKDPHPFHYVDKGTMATIGRKAAVAVVPPHHITLTGRAAWAMWGAVHLALLTGGDSRMAAMSNWFWSFTTHDRPSRVLVHPDDED